VIQQVKAGVVQSTISSVGGIASIYPMIGVLDMPFAYPNIAVTYDVFDGPFGKTLANDITKKTGLDVLGFGDSGGFFAISNSKHAIKSPEDMKGLKIRTMGLESHKTVVSSMGGQPVAINWAEVYTSLQTGVADGQMNPIPIIKFAKFDEVQKYLTLTNHLFTPYVWILNKPFFDGLSAHEKEVVRAAARSAIIACRGINRIIEASDRGLPDLFTDQRGNCQVPLARATGRQGADQQELWQRGRGPARAVSIRHRQSLEELRRFHGPRCRRLARRHQPLERSP
jgi:tripartite ATP-independent transporter DctP family solute receptor